MKDMRTIFLLAALALAGCASAPSTPGTTEYVKVRWQVASRAEVNQICNEGMPKLAQKRVWGCAKRTFDECTVYTADFDEDPELHDTLGHEVRHCLVGAYHH